jgi:peptide/nickel transport system permease protein
VSTMARPLLRVGPVRKRSFARVPEMLFTFTCLLVVAGAVLLAVFGPALAPRDPNATDIVNAFVGPISGSPLGLDSQGRDILSRVMAGARPALTGPALVVVMAMAAGSCLAIVAAWFGGWVDTLISTATDIMLGFPAIVLGVLAAAVFGPGLLGPTLALGVAYTPYVTRVLRSVVLRERARDYIVVSEVMGLSSFAVAARHLVPNVAPMVLAQGTLLFGYAMVDFAAISFLGLGVQPPTADWGAMVAGGQRGVLLGYPAESLAAGTCIVAVVIAVNFLGERMSERYGG